MKQVVSKFAFLQLWIISHISMVREVVMTARTPQIYSTFRKVFSTRKYVARQAYKVREQMYSANSQRGKKGT